MELLGKNKLFELALEYFGMQLEDAFKKIADIEYKFEEMGCEVLFIFFKDGTTKGIRFYCDEPDYFWVGGIRLRLNNKEGYEELKPLEQEEKEEQEEFNL